MTTEELVLTNRDGKPMPATLMRPEGSSRGCALVLHGVGGWRAQPLLEIVARALTEDGYTTLRFDESHGVNNPDGDFFHETTSQYLRDLEDVSEYARTQSWGESPFLLIGHSLGGLIATRYASEHPEQVAELLLLAPAVSWRSMWWTQLPFALVDLVRGHRQVLGIDGKRFRISPLWWWDFFSFDGYTYAAHVAAPTLIISAEKDHTVATPFEHRWYARKFPQAEHATITWADHDFDGHEDEVVATIRQWRTSL